MNTRPKVLFYLLALCLTGCGPSAEQQLAEALKAKAELKKAEVELEKLQHEEKLEVAKVRQAEIYKEGLEEQRKIEELRLEQQHLKMQERLDIEQRQLNELEKERQAAIEFQRLKNEELEIAIREEQRLEKERLALREKERLAASDLQRLKNEELEIAINEKRRREKERNDLRLAEQAQKEQQHKVEQERRLAVVARKVKHELETLRTHIDEGRAFFERGNYVAGKQRLTEALEPYTYVDNDIYRVGIDGHRESAVLENEELRETIAGVHVLQGTGDVTQMRRIVSSPLEIGDENKRYELMLGHYRVAKQQLSQAIELVPTLALGHDAFAQLYGLAALYLRTNSYYGPNEIAKGEDEKGAISKLADKHRAIARRIRSNDESQAEE